MPSPRASGLPLPTMYQRVILGALQEMPMYMGTVPAKVIAERRARNKRARISRRLNRGR